MKEARLIDERVIVYLRCGGASYSASGATYQIKKKKRKKKERKNEKLI